MIKLLNKLTVSNSIKVIITLLFCITPQVQAEQNMTDVNSTDYTSLWSYGLTSIRTGEPLIQAGEEHNIKSSDIRLGYNQVANKQGNLTRIGGRPLQGGEQLIITEYQNDPDIRANAQIMSIMAPIRDALLFNFDTLSRSQWQHLSAVLTLNSIKIKGSEGRGPRKILSTTQVYDYIKSKPKRGSPVMRYLEEAELELKCLAFTNIDLTNPKGDNHCLQHGLQQGVGIKDLP